ncbi:hypothetical protein BD414DRAFT_515960 [Trametes punicea]|nr:hypothetical protein BD414DRAFT_515960 [Trametes punicea]
MARQLRSRTSRPNYAELMGMLEDENGAGPSSAAQDIDDDSGSDFATEAVAEEQAEGEDEDLGLDDADGDYEEESPVKKRKRATASTREDSVLHYGSSSVASRAKKTPARATPKHAAAVIPGLALSTSRQSHALPSLHHRHRSTGVYKKEGRIERLAQPPKLFQPESTVLTNAWASSEVVSNRVNKSWGYNVGPGPLWELLEDRGWFKEAGSTLKTSEKELRPRVHEAVTLMTYEVLRPSDATPYLPTDIGTTEEGALKPPPPVACSFGPVGKQTRRELKMFEAVKMSEFFPDSKSHVFNAGAPVWALDWCPIHPDDRARHRYQQYLAVAPFPSRTHSPMIGTRLPRPSPACIQIWTLRPSQEQRDQMDVDSVAGVDASAEDTGEMRCEMVLCIDGGPAFDLKWCPLPSNDSTGVNVDGQDGPRKLGILGGTFEDGSLTFYTIPDPATIHSPSGSSPDEPLLVKLSEPLLRIELEETSCWSFDWANSEVVAIGCANGSIAVYNVGKAFAAYPSVEGCRECADNKHMFALTARSTALLPTHYFTAHQSAIRSLAWIRAPVLSASGEVTTDDPTVILSGGYDGVECITDIRDMCGNVINRTRDIVTAMEYSPYTGSAITIDHENMIKAFSVTPTMLGRGHTIFEPNGPIWSISASDYHPQLAIGVTDGSCLTTNTLRTTRRGGLVPFLEHKIYQLDYSRALGEYRMLDNFLPKETLNRANATRQSKSVPVGTGAWPPEVGIHRVVWNDGNGLARTPLLASATGSGLCRVDWLMGRWVRDPLPYMGIEGMRGETEGAFAEDEESD